MTVDKSLRVKGGLLRRRNVLTREERLGALEREGRWKPGESVFGLPKVSVRVRKARSKKKKAKEEELTAPVAQEAGAEDASEGASPAGAGEASAS